MLENNPTLFYSAVINESQCIGCTKCLPACPVDAIIGAEQQLHIVITSECIGCGLCLPPCPMDCITLEPHDTPQYNKETVKQRYQHRQQRLASQPALPAPPPTISERKSEIQRILQKKIKFKKN